MESGSNKSLYTLIAVVVFGIFLSLSYFLYQDQLKSVLADVLNKTSMSTSIKLNNNGIYPTDEKLFTINSSGKLTTFTGTNIPNIILPAYVNNTQVLTVDDGILYDKALKTLTIPEGVKVIEDAVNMDTAKGSYIGAFSRNLLTDVALPEGLVYVGGRAFEYNPLKSIYIPNSVTYIGPAAFYCDDLVTFQLSSNVQTIKYYTYFSNNFKEITIPNTVKVIEYSAFESCTLLTSLTIPDSVTAIGTKAFYNTGLTKVSLPSGIVLGTDAFDSDVVITYR
jgi:hypothetical protein